MQTKPAVKICYTAEEVVNTLRRITQGRLQGYDVDFSPCGRCFTKKVYTLKYGKRAGEIVAIVLYGSKLLCAEDIFKEIKKNEPELTDEELEGRIKRYCPWAAEGIYRYKTPRRKKRASAGSNNHHL